MKRHRSTAVKNKNCRKYGFVIFRNHPTDHPGASSVKEVEWEGMGWIHVA